VAALVLEANPALTPDAAKGILSESAHAGILDAAAAVEGALHPPLVAAPTVAPSTGLGSLEASRGTVHVAVDPTGSGVLTPVVGEVTALGAPWDAKTWSATFWTSGAWDPIPWHAVSWTGWDAKTWSAKTWSAKTWSTSDWN
jgi:serine protease AprX